MKILTSKLYLNIILVHNLYIYIAYNKPSSTNDRNERIYYFYVKRV